MNEAGQERAGAGRGASSTHAERMELIGEPREPETYVVHRGPSIWIGWAAASACAGIAAIGWYRAVQVGGERDQYATMAESLTVDVERLTTRTGELGEMLAMAKSSLSANESALRSVRLERESLEKRLSLAEESRDDLELQIAITTKTLEVARLRVEEQTIEVNTLTGNLSEATLLLARYTDLPGQGALRKSREALLTDAGTATFQWGPWDEPVIENVTGDVIWNDRRQIGFARFTGLPANDPALARYQLWIVDDRGPRRGADGSEIVARVSAGVFDVGAAQLDETGEIIIPIRVGDGQIIDGANTFSVTVENPGGEPVSDMLRRVVISK